MYPHHNQQTNVDVLIVGAGPVGMVMACELLRRGISCRLIEQRQSPVTTSRAFCLHARTLEMFNMLGIADELVARGQPIYQVTMFSNGEQLAKTSFDMSSSHTQFNYILSLPQAQTEEVIRQRLLELGGNIEFGSQLRSFVQDEQGITAQVSDHQGLTQEIRSAWMVGCDGIGSVVRRGLGITYESNPPESWLLADVKIDWELQTEEQDTLYVFFTQQSTLIAIPYPQSESWRILETGLHLPPINDKDEVVRSLTQKIADAAKIQNLRIYDPGWISGHTIRQYRVPVIRIGSCFLTGDAAHSHSPVSAQGLNTGVQDAFNLAWKLALVCQGANPKLLDTYVQERLQIATNMLKATEILTQMLSMYEPSAQAVRDNLLKMVMKHEVIRQPVLERIMPSFSELDVTYYTYEFLQEDWMQTFIPGQPPKMGFYPGEQLPDYPIRTVRGKKAQHILELLDINYTLFLFAGDGEREEHIQRLEQVARRIYERYAKYVKIHLVLSAESLLKDTEWDGTVILDTGHPYHRLHYYLGIHQPSAYLIRPDGYIAYRNQPLNYRLIENYLSQLFSRSSFN